MPSTPLSVYSIDIHASRKPLCHTDCVTQGVERPTSVNNPSSFAISVVSSGVGSVISAEMRLWSSELLLACGGSDIPGLSVEAGDMAEPVGDVEESSSSIIEMRGMMKGISDFVALGCLCAKVVICRDATRVVGCTNKDHSG